MSLHGCKVYGMVLNMESGTQATSVIGLARPVGSSSSGKSHHVLFDAGIRQREQQVTPGIGKTT